MKNFRFGNYLLNIVYTKSKSGIQFSIDFLFIGIQYSTIKFLDSYRVELSFIFLENKVGIHTIIRCP